MVALITGISGQDGSLLAEQLLEEGVEVFGLTHGPAGTVPANLAAIGERVTLLEGDLLDAESLERAVHVSEPSVVYHLAAPTYVPASWEDPEGTFAAIPGATSALLD